MPTSTLQRRTLATPEVTCFADALPRGLGPPGVERSRLNSKAPSPTSGNTLAGCNSCKADTTREGRMQAASHQPYDSVLFFHRREQVIGTGKFPWKKVGKVPPIAPVYRLQRGQLSKHCGFMVSGSQKYISSLSRDASQNLFLDKRRKPLLLLTPK